MINTKDITVVVQGPVAGTADRAQADGLTQQCLKSVRRFLPSATIILSTWQGSDVRGLEYDELVLSEDPGCAHYYVNGMKSSNNVSRQIVSTHAGLKQVKTPYVIKLRADNLLTGTGFLALFEAYQARNKRYRLFKKRVVSSTWFARDARSHIPLLYHPSDFFFFGLTEDVRRIWNIPLPDEEELYYFKTRVDPPGIRRGSYSRYVPEQYIWINCLRASGITVECDYYCHRPPGGVEQSELVLVNNLLLASPKQLGICSPKHEKLLLMHRFNMQYTHPQWLTLYRNYCDPSIKLKRRLLHQVALRANRTVAFFSKWLKEFVKRRTPGLLEPYRRWVHRF